MAKYSVTHTCGHTERLAFYGSMKDRDWRLNREQGSDCQDCRIAQANADAAQSNLTAGLPTLVGTERQIGWAESIRGKQIKAVDAVEADLLNLAAEQVEAGRLSESDAASDIAKIKAAIGWLRGHDSASWWIDRRVQDGRRLLNEALKATVRAEVAS